MKFIKKVLKGILLRPRIGSLGKRSYFSRPWKIANRQAIHVGDDCIIRESVVFRPASIAEDAPLCAEIRVGNAVYIGNFSQLHCVVGIEIGDHTSISDYVYINDSSHGFDPDAGPIMQQPVSSAGGIKIGKNCFLGVKTTVLSGVELGDWCVVGANSLVTQSFPAYSVVGGVPARLLSIAPRP